jgi:hypothetical protein
MQVINGGRDGWIDAHYIGRAMSGRNPRTGSALGNPFPAKAKTQAEHNRVVALYRSWLWEQVKAGNSVVCSELQTLLLNHQQGGNVKIACWCAPLPCHGDVVKACIEWADRTGYSFL